VKQYINIKAYSVILLIIGTLLLCACPGSPSQSFTPPSTPIEPAEPAESQVSEPTQETPPETVSRVDIVYFHPKRRCASCISIEIRTEDLLEKKFKDEMENGKLTFTTYELDDQQNASIVNKYGAVGSQLFITTIKNGTENIKHIEEVWMPNILNDAIAFDDFLTEQISQSLADVK
jgi:hypothetical protein